MKPKLKAKLLAALLAGLVLGFCAAFVATQPRAEAQAVVRGPSWEYRIIKSLGAIPEAQLTNQFNKLASEGWEYIGPVVSCPDVVAANGLRQTEAYSMVLFKRARR